MLPFKTDRPIPCEPGSLRVSEEGIDPLAIAMVSTRYFRHVVGTEYRVVGLERDANGSAKALPPEYRYQVKYKREGEKTVWSRNLAEFFEFVPDPARPDGPRIRRFWPSQLLVKKAPGLVTGVPRVNGAAQTMAMRTERAWCLNCCTHFTAHVGDQATCINCASTDYIIPKEGETPMWQADLIKGMNDQPSPELEKFLGDKPVVAPEVLNTPAADPEEEEGADTAAG